jgi:hypothetical protein
MVVWLVYSCCSHLEHKTSVKRFVSLQFLNLVRYSVRLFERVISPSQIRYLTQTDIHATIPAFKRAKTVHTLDRAATGISKGKAIPVADREGP